MIRGTDERTNERNPFSFFPLPSSLFFLPFVASHLLPYFLFFSRNNQSVAECINHGAAAAEERTDGRMVGRRKKHSYIPSDRPTDRERTYPSLSLPPAPARRLRRPRPFVRGRPFRKLYEVFYRRKLNGPRDGEQGERGRSRRGGGGRDAVGGVMGGERGRTIPTTAGRGGRRTERCFTTQ